MMMWVFMERQMKPVQETGLVRDSLTLLCINLYNDPIIDNASWSPLDP